MPKGVPNKKYTGEFKQRAIEYMIKNKLSYRETATQFEVCNHHRIQAWERIYLEEGPEGLYIDRRGRASAVNGEQKGRKPTLAKKPDSRSPAFESGE